LSLLSDREAAQRP